MDKDNLTPSSEKMSEALNKLKSLSGQGTETVSNTVAEPTAPSAEEQMKVFIAESSDNSTSTSKVQESRTPEEIKAERRLAARNARRHVFIETPKYVSRFDLMTEEEKLAFCTKERKRTAGVLKRRKAFKNFFMTLGVIVAVCAAILAIFPIFFTFLNSFMTSAEITDNYGKIFQSLSGHAKNGATYLSEAPKLKFVPQLVTIQQYKTLLFMSPAYLLKFWNSIILVVPIVFGQLLVSLMASYSFARYRRRRREILFFSYVILMLMPFQVTLVPNYLIADSLGILDTNWSIILPGIFSTFSTFLLTKYMRQIPSAYIEAALLDGANEWQIFTHIALPSCKSAVYALMILLFIDYWNMVEQPLILLKDEGKQPLSVFLSQINEAEIGIAFAASTLYMIPALLIFLLGEEYLVEGISRSGVK
ncbi:MAG: carbohydrate ABC transporter permease [Clostridia bacterium]|nr:carbohydrate ABC transporter permease [Clostridia bacterium]